MQILITLQKKSHELFATTKANGIETTVKMTLRAATRVRAVDTWIRECWGGISQADSASAVIKRPDAYELEDTWHMQILLHGILKNLVRQAMAYWNNSRRK